MFFFSSATYMYSFFKDPYMRYTSEVHIEMWFLYFRIGRGGMTMHDHAIKKKHGAVYQLYGSMHGSVCQLYGSTHGSVCQLYGSMHGSVCKLYGSMHGVVLYIFGSISQAAYVGKWGVRWKLMLIVGDVVFPDQFWMRTSKKCLSRSNVKVKVQNP